MLLHVDIDEDLALAGGLENGAQPIQNGPARSVRIDRVELAEQ